MSNNKCYVIGHLAKRRWVIPKGKLSKNVKVIFLIQREKTMETITNEKEQIEEIFTEETLHNRKVSKSRFKLIGFRMD